MQAILKVRPDAIFIQSESSEYFHAESPAAIKPAEILNAERFLSLDLNYGRRVDSEMYEYLLDNGMTRDEYHFFLGTSAEAALHHGQRLLRHQRAPGLRPTAAPRASGEVFGYDEITRQYYDRYRLPVMHTETNLREGPNGDEAVNWLWKEWANVLRVRNDGVPIVGFTWYSLTDQVDWDTALREQNNRVNPLGLYDLDRNIRAGRARLQAADQRTGATCCRRRASASSCRSCRRPRPAAALRRNSAGRRNAGSNRYPPNHPNRRSANAPQATRRSFSSEASA